MEITIIILVVLASVSLGLVFNLLRKNEAQEDYILKQQKFIEGIRQAIILSDSKLKEIDAKNSFKSDDEIGWFFKNVLYIQGLLNEFINEEDKQNPRNNTSK